MTRQYLANDKITVASPSWSIITWDKYRNTTEQNSVGFRKASSAVAGRWPLRACLLGQETRQLPPSSFFCIPFPTTFIPNPRASVHCIHTIPTLLPSWPLHSVSATLYFALLTPYLRTLCRKLGFGVQARRWVLSPSQRYITDKLHLVVEGGLRSQGSRRNRESQEASKGLWKQSHR